METFALDTLEAMGEVGTFTRGGHFTLADKIHPQKQASARLYETRAVSKVSGPVEAKRGGSVYMSGLEALFEAHTVLFDGHGTDDICASSGGSLALALAAS